jgi:hypothetical protein
MKYTDPRPTCVMDSECFVNYWSIAFRCVDTGRTKRFSMFNDSAPLDRKGIARIFKNWRVVTFNGIGYDMPMIALAMTGVSNGKLKQASDGIIQLDIRPWQFFELHELAPLPDYIDHIDLMEVSPGSPQKPSLKMYAGRLHSKRMQDLPFDVDHRLSPADVLVVEDYHNNDLDVTRDFFFELKAQVDIRCQISDQYRVDVRSKSDAQIAEAVIKAEIERETRSRVYRPDVKPTLFHYVAPEWVRFQTPQMQEVLTRILDTPFAVRGDGVVEMPAFLGEAKIILGSGAYQMGIGGLHSTESRVEYVSDDDEVLIDRDVTSYYPSLILMLMLYPKHLGKAFLKIYKSIFDRRLAAKKSGDKVTAETLKIVLNGLFGKFGSVYSVLYSPNLMIQTTVSGQLAILMLIEDLVLRGFLVVSANTDGFVTKVPRSRYGEFEAVVLDWQWATGLMTEETRYARLNARDVNSYCAITEDGKVKLKGALAKGGPGQAGASGMKKNPTTEICIDAVIAYLKDGTPLSETIYDCDDIRKFVTIRRVNGGAVKDGELVGKVIRFYYARGVSGTLKYRTTGNDVPKTAGARPLMELPDELPDDIDYEWYVREATALLEDVGHRVVDPALAGRTGYMLAAMPDQVTFHNVALPSGVAACGKAPSSLREQWREHSGDGKYRVCSKCRKALEL